MCVLKCAPAYNAVMFLLGRYRLSFDKVYWNSRLHAEHSRIVDGLKKGDVVADMMAGIGPFAMPAARFGCKV